ncbi:hypothetical protein ES703_103500 [subsurface metagenome]
MIYISLRINNITLSNKPNISIPITFKENLRYFIKLHVWSRGLKEYRQIEIFLKIKELTRNGNEIVSREEKFFNRKVFEWMPESSYPVQEFTGNGYLSLEFPDFQNNTFGIDIEMIQYNHSIVTNLKIEDDKRIWILKAVENYAKDNYRKSINCICLFSEYIAEILASKRSKKKIKNFREAVNILCNMRMSRKTRINYNFLGALLWPIYYVRNQLAHPHPKIAFDKSLTEMLLENLTQIVKYLANKKIIISS